jgi:hypothetical protein
MNSLIELPDQRIVRLQLRGEVEERIASHSDNCDPDCQDDDRDHQRAPVRKTPWTGWSRNNRFVGHFVRRPLIMYRSRAFDF